MFLNSLYKAHLLGSEYILHKAKDEKERKVSPLMVIYSWTFKLLMRTNEAVFQSVSM